mgnify:CR=1 FL=1|jgi:hypothetical protein
MDNNEFPTHRRNEHFDEKKKKHSHLRNVLNIIFMVVAIIGLCIYFLWNKDIGTYTILIAIGFKFVECCIRLI